MPLNKRSAEALLAGALLVVAAVPGAHLAQGAMQNEARAGHDERAVTEAERRRQARVEQRGRMERARAHAWMPSTLYASTPDSALPPTPLSPR